MGHGTGRPADRDRAIYPIHAKTDVPPIGLRFLAREVGPQTVADCQIPAKGHPPTARAALGDVAFREKTGLETRKAEVAPGTSASREGADCGRRQMSDWVWPRFPVRDGLFDDELDACRL